MMNPLNKRFPKEFKANIGRYISTFLLLVITIIVGSGALVVMEGAKDTLDETDVENIIEDGFFETKHEISRSALKAINKRDINVYENFYIKDKEFDGNAKFYVFNERTEVDLPSLFEGRLPDETADDEIALDRIFAINRDIHIGDRIDVNGDSLLVTGIVALPDYNALFLDNQDSSRSGTCPGLRIYCGYPPGSESGSRLHFPDAPPGLPARAERRWLPEPSASRHQQSRGPKPLIR